MKVLVTGAGGRIGTHLTRQLLDEGHEVRAFGLTDDPRLQAVAQYGAQLFPGDLTDAGTLPAAAEGIDAVCHLAAALTTHDVSDDKFVDVNFRGTFNLLEAVKNHAPDVQRVVYTSSDAVYWSAHSDRLPEDVIDERSPVQPGSVYGATKVGAELLCRSYYETYGIPFAVMRPTATADPAELINPRSVFGRRWFVGAAIAWYQSRTALGPADQDLLSQLEKIDNSGEKLFALVASDGRSSTSTLGDARDAAAGMRALIDSPAAVGEAFDIGPADFYDDREFVQHLGRRLELEVVEIRSPAARPSWPVSSRKAMDLVGYRPTRTVFQMIDEAVAGRAVEEGASA